MRQQNARCMCALFDFIDSCIFQSDKANSEIYISMESQFRKLMLNSMGISIFCCFVKWVEFICLPLFGIIWFQPDGLVNLCIFHVSLFDSSWNLLFVSRIAWNRGINSTVIINRKHVWTDMQATNNQYFGLWMEF